MCLAAVCLCAHVCHICHVFSAAAPHVEGQARISSDFQKEGFYNVLNDLKQFCGRAPQALELDSWPLPLCPPPLISVRQLYMLGLTISPETHPPPSAISKHMIWKTGYLCQSLIFNIKVIMKQKRFSNVQISLTSLVVVINFEKALHIA